MEGILIKIKNLKRFKIFIIISVLVLILLVWCMIWINIVSNVQKQEGDHNNSTLDISDTEQKIEKGKIDYEEQDIKNEIGKTKDKQLDKESDLPETNENINNPDKKTNETDSSLNDINSNKPMVVPEELSENELFSAYNNTLIIGDSRIEGFKLYSGVKNANYFCVKAITIEEIAEGKKLTINGNSVSVFDLLDSGTYEKVIVSVGLNELGWVHIDKFLEYYGYLIDKIKEKQPDATVYLQAVLPVSKAKNDSDKIYNNAQIYWYNENIIKLASEKGVEFVNPAAALVDEQGYLVAQATTDGVHFNSEYCKVWAKYLAGLV